MNKVKNEKDECMLGAGIILTFLMIMSIVGTVLTFLLATTYFDLKVACAALGETTCEYRVTVEKSDVYY